MHLIFLIEDQSGEKLINCLVPKIINPETTTYETKSYKGIGHIPKNHRSSSDLKNQHLLAQLPRLLNGYGNTYKDTAGYAIIVVCDLDDKNEAEFISDLQTVHQMCSSKPVVYFRLAIEEMEAWLLGDKDAVIQAYQRLNKRPLSTYNFDEICGTWERLADIVYPGGASKLKEKGHQEIGKMKSEWAVNIGQHINVEKNLSPSFIEFKNLLKDLDAGYYPDY